MSSILSGILAVIVSIAMAFGGVSELPSVPETATRVSVGNLSVTVNGQEASTDAVIDLTTAVGTDEALAQLGFELGGDRLLDAAVKLTADSLSAAIGDSDNVYTISESAVQEMTGIDPAQIAAQLEDPNMQKVLGIIDNLWKDLNVLIEYSKDPEASKEMRTQLLAVLFKDAEVKDVTVAVDGTAIPAVQYNADLTMETVLNVYDWMENCGIEPVENYMKDMLEIMSLSAQQEFTSLRQVVEAAGAGMTFSFPIECVIAETDEVSYQKAVYSAGANGMAVSLNAEEITRKDGTIAFAVTVSANSDDEESKLITMSLTGDAVMTDGALTAVNAVMDMDQHDQYIFSYSSDEDAETGETDEAETDPISGYKSVTDMKFAMEFNAEKNDCGWDLGGDLSCAMDYDYADLGTGESMYNGTQSVAMSGSVVNTAEADGSKTAAVSFIFSRNMSDDEHGLDAGVSFTVNTAAVPYTDPMAGKTNTIELTAGMEEMPKGLQDDITTLMNVLVRVGQNEDLQKLAGIFNADDVVDVVDDVVEGEAEDTGYVTIDEMKDWNDVACYFAAEAPAINLPENCAWLYGFASEEGDYIGAGIVNADDELMYDVSVVVYGFDAAEYIEEGAVMTTVEDRPVQLEMNEDGTVAYAQVYDGDNVVFVYYYNPVDQAFVEQMIADLM